MDHLQPAEDASHIPVHYRRALATLRPVEIPPRYWPNLATLSSLGVALLGLLLAAYLVIDL